MKAYLTCSMGFKLSISKLALVLIVLLIKDMATESTKDGNLVYSLHRSSANSLSELNPESKTSPAIEGSLSACIIAVIAPIDLPQRPIVLTYSLFLRYFTTSSMSSRSYQPNEIYSPSDLPQPFIIIIIIIIIINIIINFYLILYRFKS